jgi:hypothetical protein
MYFVLYFSAHSLRVATWKRSPMLWATRSLCGAVEECARRNASLRPVKERKTAQDSSDEELLGHIEHDASLTRDARQQLADIVQSWQQLHSARFRLLVLVDEQLHGRGDAPLSQRKRKRRPDES